MPELYEALIALTSILMAGALRLAVNKLRKTQNELKYKRESTPEEIFRDGIKNIRLSMREMNIIAREISSACRNTKIDRLLVLTCVNGGAKPERASVMWDENNIETPWNYDDVRLDSDYQGRIEQIIRKAHLQFRAEDAKNTLIGGLYANEGVRESIWIIIAKKASIDTDQIGYFFLSASTHEDDPMGNDELRAAQNIAILVRNILLPHGYVLV